MAGTVPGSKSEKINVVQLFLAKITSDEVASIVWGTPKYYSGVQEINISLEYIEDEAYAEGQKVVDDANLNGGTIDITANQFSNEERAEILAYIDRVTASGVNEITDSKERFEYAVGYIVEFADGSKRYRWWYKTNPVLKSEALSAVQSTNNVNRQSDIITFNLLKTNFEITKVSSLQKVKLFGRTTQTDDPDFVEATATAWFTEPRPTP